MTSPTLDWGLMLNNATPTPSFGRDYLDQLKASMPLEWVVARSGVPVAAAGDRLVGSCPFHGGSGDFAVYSLPTDDLPLTRVGCWSAACVLGGDGDVFAFLQHQESLSFADAVRRAAELATEFQSAVGAWAPTQVAPAVRANPDDLAHHAMAGSQLAASNRDAIERLIDEKLRVREEAGWQPVTADFLIQEWGVGVEDDRVVVVPHRGADGAVRGLKTRTARSHLIAARGSELCALYGEHRDRGRSLVLLVEGESDAWCASALLADQEVDVLALPSGAHARPKTAWLDRLRGRNVLIAFDGDATGRAASVRWLRALDGVARSAASAHLSDGHDIASTPPDDLLRLLASSTEPAPAAAALPMERLSLDELRAMPEPEWLVEDLLPAVGTGQVYGPSNLGKTFVVIDLVLSIASGQTFWHDYVIRPAKANVGYVAIEDEGDWKHRVDAWVQAHPGADLSGLVSYFPRGLIDLSAYGAAEAWVEYFKDEDLSVLVIDTQAQASGGAEENSNTEMGRMMANLRQISTRLGCMVMTVHHTGTIGTRARGASSQIGALDVQISVLPPKGRGDNASPTPATDFVEQPITGVVQVEKARSARKRPGTAFRLQPSGSSVYARPIARLEASRVAVSEDEAQRWQIIRALVRMGGNADSVRKIRAEIADHNETVVTSTRRFAATLEQLCVDRTITKLQGEGAKGGDRYEVADLAHWSAAVEEWAAGTAQSANVVALFGGAGDD